ncbi:MAG: hypothetical protein ABGY41_00160, partial [Candidatus Poribacteria bacterium]
MHFGATHLADDDMARVGAYTHFEVHAPSVLNFGSQQRHRPEDAESAAHGTLTAYTGRLSVDLVVGCTYVANLASLFDKHQATVRAQVMQTEDNWKISVDIAGTNRAGDDEGDG